MCAGGLMDNNPKHISPKTEPHSLTQNTSVCVSGLKGSFSLSS